MALIKKNELKKMSEAEMLNKLTDLKKQLMKLRAQIATGTLPENPGQVRAMKRTIAKLLTLLNLKKGAKEAGLQREHEHKEREARIQSKASREKNQGGKTRKNTNE